MWHQVVGRCGPETGLRLSSGWASLGATPCSSLRASAACTRQHDARVAPHTGARGRGERQAGWRAGGQGGGGGEGGGGGRLPREL